MKKLVSLVLIVALCLSFAGCKSDPEAKAKNDLWKAKTEYVGDNSKVTKILTLLKMDMYGEYTIKLETEKEPYGLKIYYKDEVYSPNFDYVSTLMLGLIKNLSYVEIHHGSEVYKMTTETATEKLGFDVKEMYGDKGKFTAFYDKGYDE